MSTSEHHPGHPTPAAAHGPVDADVAQAIAERGITRVRHFTTNRGVLGIIATGQLLSRRKLAVESYLEHIYYPNCATRRDGPWTGHVSLSLTDINASFFAICSGQPTWHANMDGFWVIIDLDPTILTHPGVEFTTTNNMYSGVERGQGIRGLDGMFADPIRPYRPLNVSPTIRRGPHLTDAQPTDAQAEVLYPDHVPASYIDRLIVRDDTHTNELQAQMHVFRCIFPQVPVEVDASAFDPRPIVDVRSPLIDPS